jgi:hypothetical protein
MSDRVFARNRNFLLSLFALTSILFAGANLQAQDNSDTPKYDIFVGYQWLHPGANVPDPLSTQANPVTFQVPDMPKGFGASVTFNLDRHWGLEGDFGHNWDNYETTASVGLGSFFETTTALSFFMPCWATTGWELTGSIPATEWEGFSAAAWTSRSPDLYRGEYSKRIM